jgi:hypothetical protein
MADTSSKYDEAEQQRGDDFIHAQPRLQQSAGPSSSKAPASAAASIINNTKQQPERQAKTATAMQAAPPPQRRLKCALHYWPSAPILKSLAFEQR